MSEIIDIEQLNGALTDLIIAYEKLQNENRQLEDKINSLTADNAKIQNSKDKLEEHNMLLASENKRLEEEASNLRNTANTQKSQIGGMYNKISSLISREISEDKDKSSANSTKDKTNASKQHIKEESSEEVEEDILDLKISKDTKEHTQGQDVQKSKQTDNKDSQPQNNKNENTNNKKLDLGRMESLLNGLNR